MSGHNNLAYGHPGQQHQQYQPGYDQQQQYYHVREQRTSDPYSENGSISATRIQSLNGEPFMLDGASTLKHSDSVASSVLTDSSSYQQDSSQRTAAPRGRRRADTVTSAAVVQPPEAGLMPSLDDYEAMLQQMTSPTLGPKETRSRRLDREPREGREGRTDRQARQTRRQQQQQRGTEPMEDIPQILQELETLQRSSGSGRRNHRDEQQSRQQRLSHQPNQQMLTTGDSMEAQGTGEESFNDKKIRRRSSLPSKLKAAPNMFSGLQRSNSGHDHASPKVSEPPSIETVFEYGATDESRADLYTNGKASSLPEVPLGQQQEERKRYSWEDETVAPRIDLIEAAAQAKGASNSRPSSVQRKNSWQEQDDDLSHQQNPHNISQERSPRLSLSGGDPALSSNSGIRLSQLGIKPPVTSKSRLRLSQTPTDIFVSNVNIVPPTPLDAESLEQAYQERLTPETEGVISFPMPPTGMPPSVQRPITPTTNTAPMSSKSRPSTPVGVIRPPPGPAPSPPAGAPPNPGASPIISRKVSPSSGRRGINSGSSSSMLQPIPISTLSRPRAGSIASNSSMNSFTMDGPPPPSSPLPSLPPPPLHALPPIVDNTAGSEMPVGLGISHMSPGSGQKSRMTSLSSRDLIVSLPLPPMQSIPTPPSIPAPIAEGDVAEVSANGHGQPGTQLTRLRKRISLLEKQLANTESALSTKIRDSDELQSKMGELLVERDSLEKKLALIEVQGESGERSLQHEHELQRAVQKIQEEKQSLEDLIQRQGHSKTEAEEEVDRLRAQLKTKEDEIMLLKTTSNSILTHPVEHDSNEEKALKEEVEILRAMRSDLERDLTEAQGEIRRLSDTKEESVAFGAKESRGVRESLEEKTFALSALHVEHEEQRRLHTEAMTKLEQQVQRLSVDIQSREEIKLRLEREVEAFAARSQQEEVQYGALQDTVQRLTSKMARLEAQHAQDLEKIQQDHEEVMDRVVVDHANTLERLQHEIEQLQEVQQNALERIEGNRSSAERESFEARERVLQERADEQMIRNDVFEEKLFRMEKAFEAIEKEKEVLTRANRSLERHLSMQHLQEQENAFKMEELERENARLRKILVGLDVLVRQDETAKEMTKEEKDEKENEEVKETEEQKKQLVAQTYEEKQRKWAEQVELLERRLSKSQEESRRIQDQNVDLRSVIEVARGGGSPLTHQPMHSFNQPHSPHHYSPHPSPLAPSFSHPHHRPSSHSHTFPIHHSRISTSSSVSNSSIGGGRIRSPLERDRPSTPISPAGGKIGMMSMTNDLGQGLTNASSSSASSTRVPSPPLSA
ncbi:hypothetical protein BGW38_003768 [Lunasporangiospora selenospora]|uniref:Uncharacterized protein n=1 Tax=Lunasporangiospora selenospora TaxID=979761 RepID=A0A9P6KCM0_9FUNG|nr:hypothetical protein BGW38_003768 [Lunasporangiospora selenospora]